MPNEKVYTAKQAAEAVLAKASEMLAKAEMPKHLAAPAEKDQTGPQGVKADPNPAAPNDKVNGNPAPGALPQNHVKFAAEGLKGHLKLAKFVGRMEEKRKSKTVAVSAVTPSAPAAPASPAAPALGKAETGHEKGINVAAHGGQGKGKNATPQNKANQGMSAARFSGKVASDNKHASNPEKAMHSEVAKQIKTMPKPKLPS